ncbi:hypothetical protein AB0H71_25350 [Nocardia sp. NPDC050697]|uniref:hypothetical protein n=1 Tax=Nocardia sp. NPDC050697 TaxID=3155158 RepID=UPI0033C024BD
MNTGSPAPLARDDRAANTAEERQGLENWRVVDYAVAGFVAVAGHLKQNWVEHRMLSSSAVGWGLPWVRHLLFVRDRDGSSYIEDALRRRRPQRRARSVLQSAHHRSVLRIEIKVCASLKNFDNPKIAHFTIGSCVKKRIRPRSASCTASCFLPSRVVQSPQWSAASFAGFWKMGPGTDIVLPCWVTIPTSAISEASDSVHIE